MTLYIFWQKIVLVILASYKLSKCDVNTDERTPHGAGRNQIASGNGINGINYGFFGSFNYDFQHRKPHKVPPSTTTTSPATSPILSVCPEENPASSCLYPTNCFSNNECNFNEICCQVRAHALKCCVQIGATQPTTPPLPPPTTPYQWITTTAVTEILDLCPDSISYPMCLEHSDVCNSGKKCFPKEFCCQTNVHPPCCLQHGSNFSTTTTETTTSDFIGFCDIPNDSSIYKYHDNLTCYSHEDCPRSECCIGPNGRGCYDWPTRVPAPGSLCPVGYAQCALSHPETPFTIERSCDSEDYQSVCHDDEYCCAIGPTPLACCVKRSNYGFLTSDPSSTQ